MNTFKPLVFVWLFAIFGVLSLMILASGQQETWLTRANLASSQFLCAILFYNIHRLVSR